MWDVERQAERAQQRAEEAFLADQRRLVDEDKAPLMDLIAPLVDAPAPVDGRLEARKVEMLAELEEALEQLHGGDLREAAEHIHRVRGLVQRSMVGDAPVTTADFEPGFAPAESDDAEF